MKKPYLLMKDFYNNVIKGDDYAESLRKAKIEQIKNGELPVSWGGFILIGN